MGLTVTGCELDGETVSIRCEDGLIAALGPDVEAADGDEVIDGSGFLLCPPFVNAPHPRGDDPVPGLRGRPAADGLARELHLAGRGEARARGRLLGHPPGRGRDAPLGHHAASSTCTGTRARSRGRSATPGCAAVVSSVLIDGLDPKRGCELREKRDRGDRRAGGLRSAGDARVRPARDLHRQRASRSLAGRDGGRARADAQHPPLRDQAGGGRLRHRPREAPGPLPGRARASSARARCSPTASGSTPRSSS